MMQSACLKKFQVNVDFGVQYLYERMILLELAFGSNLESIFIYLLFPTSLVL